MYLLSLFGYHWLATAPGQPADPDLSTEDNSVVLVRIEQLHPVEHRLDVKVLVMPDNSVIDKRLGVLTSDAWCGLTRTTTWATCSTPKESRRHRL